MRYLEILKWRSRLRCSLDDRAPVVGRLAVRSEGLANRVSGRLLVRYLEGRNRDVVCPVTGSAPAIVSLTSYGRRLNDVYLAIEAIAAGSVRPERIILWVDDLDPSTIVAGPLHRLIQRGLEVRRCANLGPHKKYFPMLEEMVDESRRLLVTADDDVLYPRWWLARLLEKASAHPGEIVCYRAHRIRVEDRGLAPYVQWQPCWGRSASVVNFSTGVSGVAFPHELVVALAQAGLEFMSLAPMADDIWIHSAAVRAGIPVRQVHRWPRNFPDVPGSQAVGLLHVNVSGSGNDAVISEVYTADLIELLVEASSR